MKTKRIIALIVAIMLILTTLTYATETTDVVENSGQTEIMPRTSIEDDYTSNADEIYVDPETGEEYGISLLENDYDETTTEDYVDGDFYGADEVVNVEANINGNVFAIGKTVNINNAYISGDIFVAAKEINITSSTITGSIFALADAINLSYSYTSDVYMLAEKVNFDINSYIYRDVKIAGNEINLAGRIVGNAYIAAKTLNIEEETMILGKLNYSADSECQIPSSADITEYDFSQNSNEKEDAVEEFNAMSVLMSAIIFLIKVAIISGFLLIYSTNFKKVNDSESKGTAKKLVKFAGTGILVLILVPIIAIALALTIVGTGFGVALIGIYAILLYCATAIASLSIAMFILKNKENSKLKIWSTSLGVALAIWLIGKIPYIGVICKFIALIIGLGSAKATIFYKNKKNNKEELSGLAAELNEKNTNVNAGDSENNE